MRAYCHVTALLLIATVALSGCGKKGGTAPNDSAPVPVSAEQIAAVRDTLIRGMQPVSFTRLTPSHAGKLCVVETETPQEGLQLAPPPPPPGMVHGIGQVTFYRGELDAVTPDSLTIRKPYPTSGNVKKIDIPKACIRSIYLSP